MENNNVIICGRLHGNPYLSHQVHGEDFYRTELRVKRLSGVVDTIPVVLSEHLLFDEMKVESLVKVIGSYRSRLDMGKLKLYVFAEYVELASETECYQNDVELHGFLTRPVVYRVTPQGRGIADLTLAINRPTGRADYVPAIIWGRNARMLDGELPGRELIVHGRIQSRQYIKRLDDGTEEERTAYEVSVCGFTLIKE